MILDAIRKLPRDERVKLYKSLAEPGALSRLIAPNETALVATALELGGSREAAVLLLESAVEPLRATAATAAA